MLKGAFAALSEMPADFNSLPCKSLAMALAQSFSVAIGAGIPEHTEDLLAELQGF